MKGLGLRTLALVALAAVIAAGAIFTSATPAEAQAVPSTTNPGGTVVVTFNEGGDTGDRFRIHEDSEASGSFDFNGGQAVRCSDNDANGCDENGDTAGVALRVTIDEDSPIGDLFVQRTERAGDGEVTVEQEIVVTVAAPDPPVALNVIAKPTPGAIDKDGTPTSSMTVRLVNAAAVGQVGQDLVVTTTRGILTSTHMKADTTCNGLSACTLTTQAAGDGVDNQADTDDDVVAGSATVTLAGNGATGTAMVSFLHAPTGLSATAEVTIHGDTAGISVEAEQGTIGIAGSTFLVVTIVDAQGNPVVGGHAAVDTADRKTGGIVPPEVPTGTSAVKVMAPRDVDKNLEGKKNDLPACGNDVSTDEANTEDVDEGATNADLDPGSNVAGKCVIQVNAPIGDPDNPADDATRGTHTITLVASNAAGVALPKIDKVSVAVQVGGAPASISSDAPASVDSLSSTEITVTVMDDEGVRVGAVLIVVDQVEGEGKTDSPASPKTADGQATFTYLAPLSAGDAVFLIRAGDAEAGTQIQSTITVVIGDPEPEAPPAPAQSPVSLDVSAGGDFYVVAGNSVPTTASDLFDGTSVSVAFKWENGAWTRYVPALGSEDFLVASGNLLWVVAGSAGTVGG